MKRFISIFTLLAIFLSSSISVFAEDAFTVRNSVVKSVEEYSSINVATPYFEGFQGSDKVNRLIRDITIDSIGEARASAKLIKQENNELVKEGEEYISRGITLDTIYDYTKNGNILSIYLRTYYYSGGAHPINWINSITVNTSTGEVYSFDSLFKEGSKSGKLISDKIISKVDKNPELYFSDAKNTITDKNGKFNFYFVGNELVVYFDIYDIAPYAAGTQYFVFNAEDIKNELKAEVYNSIKDAKAKSNIRLNGSDINSKITSYLDEYNIMVPLREIAEILGYKVDWNKADGAIIAGGFIKNGVDSYRTTAKEPVSLGKPVITNGVTFVPIQYFTEVLGENVTFEDFHAKYISGNDKDIKIIRIFDKNKLECGFNDLVIKFENATTSKDAIEMYAKSVKERNGAIQYGLMNKGLRESNYLNFKDLSFVTGVSSPWVDSYEIIETGDNAYQIKFHLKTSVPTDEITTITNASLIQDGEYWKINSLVNITE